MSKKLVAPELNANTIDVIEVLVDGGAIGGTELRFLAGSKRVAEAAAAVVQWEDDLQSMLETGEATPTDSQGFTEVLEALRAALLASGYREEESE